MFFLSDAHAVDLMASVFSFFYVRYGWEWFFVLYLGNRGSGVLGLWIGRNSTAADKYGNMIYGCTLLLELMRSRLLIVS